MGCSFLVSGLVLQAIHCLQQVPNKSKRQTQQVQKPMASANHLSPYTFLAQKKYRPVSYYAFFKGWLLPSPPSGCLSFFTSFIT